MKNNNVLKDSNLLNSDINRHCYEFCDKSFRWMLLLKDDLSICHYFTNLFCVFEYIVNNKHLPYDDYYLCFQDLNDVSNVHYFEIPTFVDYILDLVESDVCN